MDEYVYLLKRTLMLGGEHGATVFETTDNGSTFLYSVFAFIVQYVTALKILTESLKTTYTTITLDFSICAPFGHWLGDRVVLFEPVCRRLLQVCGLAPKTAHLNKKEKKTIISIFWCRCVVNVCVFFKVIWAL